MLEIAGVKPFTLAQLNTTVGAPGSGPAGPAVERPSGTTVTGAGGGAGAGGSSATQGVVGAQTAPATQGGGAAKQDGPGLGGLLLPMIVILVVFYFVMFRGQKKDEKKRKEMITTLKKGDRVMTIGGMLASVVSVEGDEVVLKIDESANVKARYRKSSIQEVIDRDEKKN